MQLTDRSTCTGCGACYEVCPRHAIQWDINQEGFQYPQIIEEQCIECGRCEKVCPVLHKPEENEIKAAYAAQIRDQSILKDSTSGGVFTVLAREIFKRDGVVYGCVWDDDYNAVVKKAETEAEIEAMRGSKYVWSWAGDVFPEIKQYLDAGRTVLFTGLPCQVAGLKNYLNRDYEKLYLVDFFCGGAPSPYAFHEYLKTITRDVPQGMLNFKFRDKEKHGVGVHISYLTNKGKVTQTYVHNPYFFSYHTKVFLRPSCYQCQYRYARRVEDLTFGDYWGVEKYHSEFDVRAGVSAVLVNSTKGTELLEAVKDNLYLTDTNVENIAAGNNLTLADKQVVFQAPRFRNDFFDTLRSKGWKAAERRFLYNRTRLKLWLKMRIPSKYIKMGKRLIKGR